MLKISMELFLKIADRDSAIAQTKGTKRKNSLAISAFLSFCRATAEVPVM